LIGTALLAALLQVAAAPSTQPGALRTPISAATAAQAEPGSNLRVYLLTMGPGDQVWEKFGHNAIWIHDGDAGTDIAYHWGLFDFADKEFVSRFIQGRMRYSMGAFDMEQTIDAYRQSNRTVWAQELNLSPSQRKKLAGFIAWNVRPENRYYSYDYFRDNCSTRVRDAIDMALGGVIQASSDTVMTATTYRFHTSRLTQDDWWVFTGTMMGLGEPVDRPLSAWEEMFLPVRMKDRLVSVTVPGASGREPLVLDERVLVESTRAPEESTVERGMLGYLAIAAAILAIGAGLVFLRRAGSGGGGAISLAALWSLVAGVAGSLLAFLWAFTNHLYSYRNENLFQLNPLSLVLVALLVRAFLRRHNPGATKRADAIRDALRFAIVIAGISVLGFILQALPGIDQVNGDVIVLAMPLHLGVVAALLAIRPEPDAAKASR
jgi:hypothetical protein